MAYPAQLLALLGDPTRRGVIQALAGREVGAGELAEQLGTTPAALTRHLRLLRQADVVSVALDPDDNRRHVYRVRPEPFRELRDWADDIDAYWTAQLASFAEYAQAATSGGRRSRQ